MGVSKGGLFSLKPHSRAISWWLVQFVRTLKVNNEEREYYRVGEPPDRVP